MTGRTSCRCTSRLPGSEPPICWCRCRCRAGSRRPLQEAAATSDVQADAALLPGLRPSFCIYRASCRSIDVPALQPIAHSIRKLPAKQYLRIRRCTLLPGRWRSERSAAWRRWESLETVAAVETSTARRRLLAPQPLPRPPALPLAARVYTAQPAALRQAAGAAHGARRCAVRRSFRFRRRSLFYCC